jgi:hypothetical protein
MERSPVARALISVGIAVVLVAEVGVHLPAGSAVGDALSPSANHVSRLLATEQQWGVFAPDPRSTSLRLEARVTFEDGTTEVWTLPEGPRVGANLRYYRWRKWLERIRADSYRGLWEPTAAWIASLYDDGPSPVESVELVRFVRTNALQGTQPPYEETTYFTYEPEDGGP